MMKTTFKFILIHFKNKLSSKSKTSITESKGSTGTEVGKSSILNTMVYHEIPVNIFMYNF